MTYPFCNLNLSLHYKGWLMHFIANILYKHLIRTQSLLELLCSHKRFPFASFCGIHKNLPFLLFVSPTAPHSILVIPRQKRSVVSRLFHVLSYHENSYQLRRPPRCKLLFIGRSLHCIREKLMYHFRAIVSLFLRSRNWHIRLLMWWYFVFRKVPD